MPRFNWDMLFNNFPEKKILIVGNLEDALEFSPIAEHIYLFQTNSDNIQEHIEVNKKITLVHDSALGRLDVDIVIVFHSKDVELNTIRSLEKCITKINCHKVYIYKNSTLPNRIKQVLLSKFTCERVVFFPYKNFASCHFIDLFRSGIRCREIFKLLKHTLFRQDFGIYVPQNGSQSNIDNIIGDIINAHSLSVPTPSRIRTGSTGSFVVDLEDYILRVPGSVLASNQYCANNFSALKELSGKDLPFSVPIPVCEGAYAGNHYYVESKISGTSLDLMKIDDQGRTAVFNHALSALMDPRMRGGPITEQQAFKLINHEIDEVTDHLTAEQVLFYKKVCQSVVDLVVSKQIPLVITHGDYKNSNFIITPGKIPSVNGVIDWEFSPLYWFPLYDFFVLAVYSYYQINRQHDVVIYMSEIGRGQTCKDVNVLLKQFADALHLDEKVILPLTIICMLRYINITFSVEQKKKRLWLDFFSEQIDPVARQFIKSLYSSRILI